MRKKLKPLIFLHIMLFVYSLCGIASKTAAKYEMFSKEFIFFYGIVLLGLMIYAVVWQQILKVLPVTMAYVNKAVTIIWGLLWGMLFFQEHITWNKVAGAIVIIIGVYFVISGEEE